MYSTERHFSIAEKLKLEVVELGMLAKYPATLSTSMDRALSLKQLFLLSRFKLMQNSTVSAADWLEYFNRANSQERDRMQGVTDPESEHQTLSDLLDWSVDDMELFAVGPEIGIENYRVRTVEQADLVMRRIDLCRDLCVGGKEEIALERGTAKYGADWEKMSLAAKTAVGLFEDGIHVARSEGLVNERIRDGLVAIFLNKVVPQDDNLKDRITNAESLYEYLLLDVKVSSEVVTTRMLENIGCVQLYINRMLNKLEDGTVIEREEFEKTWDISREYRLWEANEKLALYPGNYVEPELRLDRTELFKQLEQDLSSEQLSEKVAETAVRRYISRLQQLSGLRPHSFFARSVKENGVVVHKMVFLAEAPWAKKNYYCQRLEIKLGDPVSWYGSPTVYETKWSEWRKMDVTVASEHVYGVLPGLICGRMYVFWFELEKRKQPEDDAERYFLRSKYSQENWDGTFSTFEPKLQEGVTLEVTDMVAELNFEISKYKPIIKPPVWDVEQEEIRIYFQTNPWEHMGIKGEGAADWCTNGAGLDHSSQIKKHGVRRSELEGQVKGYECVAALDKSHFSQLMREVGDSRVRQEHRIDVSSVWWEAGEVVWRFQPDVDVDSYGIPSVCMKVYPGEASSKLHVTSTSVRAKLDELTIECDFGTSERKRSLDGWDSREWCGLGTHEIEHRQWGILITISFREWDSKELDLHLSLTAHVVAQEKDYHGNWSNMNGGRQIICSRYSFHDVTASKDQVLLDSFNRLYRGISVDSEYYNEGRVFVPTLPKFYAYNAHYHLLIQPTSLAIHNLTTQRFDDSAPITHIFAPEHQSLPESGTSDFVNKFQRDVARIYGPEPPHLFDFDGPFGLYGWEFFYYIPSYIASKFRQEGLYHSAFSWHHLVFNPRHPTSIWNFKPLLESSQSGSTVLPLSINDPDLIARRRPQQYRLATLRHYLRTIFEEGDMYYRRETPETLRTAKMCYTAAVALFDTSLSNPLDVATKDAWTNPSLGGVGDHHFRPPFNQHMYHFYQTLQQRLVNLRNWCSIDGDPLNISLIPPPINPRKLQIAAMSRVPPSAVADANAEVFRYTFDELLAKAKAAVKNLMYFGDLLTRSMVKADDRTLEKKQANLALHIANKYELGGQMSLCKSLEKELDVLNKNKEEAEKYRDWYQKFSEEYANAMEEKAEKLLTVRFTHLAVDGVSSYAAGVAAMIPKIFGLSNGGQDYSGPAKSLQNAEAYLSEAAQSGSDLYFKKGELTRRQDENKMEYEARVKAVESICLSVERLKYDLQEEQGTKAVLREKVALTEELLAYHSQRATNADFCNWYVGQIKTYYRTAFDLTVRYCRQAEVRYREEEQDDSAFFINPIWEPTQHGLLSGQSLMLDLQRMELAFMERNQETNESILEVSLSQLEENKVKFLKESGTMMFDIDENTFEAFGPDEFGRRIASVRVELKGLEQDLRGVKGRLTLFSHRLQLGRGRKSGTSVVNMCGRQTLNLSTAVTSTEDISTSGGRLRPFEKCGVHSTWMLSFPTVSKAFENKTNLSEHLDVLSTLQDVLLQIKYTHL